MIRFQCKNCGQKFSVPEKKAGQKGWCPKCKNVVIVPQSAAPSPAPLPPQEDEPLRLKYDSDLPVEPDRPVYTIPQQRRLGPESTADVTADAYKSEQAVEKKPATILNVFTFPFSVAGILHFILFWFGPFLLGLAGRIFVIACCYSQLMIIGLYIALVGYFYYYLSSCIIAAAKDERSAPDVSFESTLSFVDLLRRFFLVLGCALICFGPVVLYMLCFHILPAFGWFGGEHAGPPNWRADPVYWMLCGFGVFLFPMFLLAVAIFDSITALNPFLIIGSVASTFLPYCGLVILCFAIGLLMNFIGQLRPGGLLLFAWGLDVYLMFIAAYILGRFFRRYEGRLNWEIEL
jgi:hypothetical protein